MCIFLAIVLEFVTYKLDFFAEAEGLERESLSASYILSHDTLVDVGLGHVCHLFGKRTLRFLIILLLIF